ncbi:MBL fold metallo-hydrolase [Chromobacterium subtsugae]|uniref:MBL fold metallo-hydrolase n=1 Tax=Chromobacterium subtsugae TaxID=251747 RepID=A0ABS7FFJ7_9NEIS|nr:MULTISPECIES: MBL fold metallo-hydrolase [Chromobacterium]KUM04932.1 MBL fold metallo-hydrolase [Chromobacterium subtsugae]KZE86952.1 MBL fold metallo-hydrolase [Chromobacterium sp. F49]MBW7566783.1 MBL fold metallo-hydrolase [Chromobacterium subtsugae]MBW8288088.1 MBL fold metallo-hydrolase [Chromobacterium subtsugae]WSE92769.1 MBL fold metallo-hydrolase [Chromobacterium subtsugae]
MNTLEVTILGCGSSSGTPAIGCRCATCLSGEPRNRRTRASAYVRVGELGFLIDTGPDLRQQALREGLSRLDAVLYTHPHADHLNGIDDLRAFCYLKQGPISLYGNDFTMSNIRERFGYALQAPSKMWDKPVLLPETVHGPFEHQGVKLTPIPLRHGSWPCLGWRIGNMAWLTDLSDIPESSLPLLQGLELLFLDCLNHDPYPSHLGVGQAFDWAARIGARRTVLIHMTHRLEYHALGALCPPGVEVGFDGWQAKLAMG